MRLLPLLALLCLPAPAAALQDPDDDPALQDKLERLDEVLSSREDEAQAISLLEEFTAGWQTARKRQKEILAAEEAGDFKGDPVAQREARGELRAVEERMEVLAEAVGSPLTHRRRKQITEPNLVLWRATAACLSRMEEAGADLLWEAFEERRFDDEPDLRGIFLESIGPTHAYKYAEPLVDLLDHYEHLYIAKAATALAEFGDAPGKVRHMAVDKLAKLLAEYYEAVQNANRAAAQPGGVDPGAARERQRAQERYRKVGPSMIRALEALTGVKQAEPLEWRRWFNKHKRDAEIWGDDA